MFGEEMSLSEYQDLEMRYDDLENLRIESLIKIQKDYNLSDDIMDSLSYDVEFFETLENLNEEKMFELIKSILKINYGVIL